MNETQQDMFVDTPHGMAFAPEAERLVAPVRHTETTARPRTRRLTKPTQADRLLAYLRKHGHITKDEGRDELGIRNVGGRILDLREAGHHIRTEMIPVQNRFEEDTEIAKYILEDRQ